MGSEKYCYRVSFGLYCMCVGWCRNIFHSVIQANLKVVEEEEGPDEHYMT